MTQGQKPPAPQSSGIELDIVIPVYNEGKNILSVLNALEEEVISKYRVLICYDFEEDNTLPVVRSYLNDSVDIEFVKNTGIGPHQAIMTGFNASVAPAVLVLPADDDYNAGIIDTMLARFHDGCEIVCASRFMRDGRGLEGAPWIKNILVWTASFTLYHFARLPSQDATNGFRMFSRRLLGLVDIESGSGFVYSLELLVKAGRLGFQIGQVSARWIERTQGKSRFQILRWLPAYLRWYFYGFATYWLGRGPDSVSVKSANDTLRVER